MVVEKENAEQIDESLISVNHISVEEVVVGKYLHLGKFENINI
jgi:hypothetical protein